MKWTAVIFNLLLIAMVVFLIITEGVPDGEDVFFVALLLAAPISSLFALLIGDEESWIGLYFKRKALEEKNKIESLDKGE